MKKDHVKMKEGDSQMLVEDKKNLAISVAGGFVAGGSLLAYQIGLSYNWGPLISGTVGVIVGLAIHNIFLRKLKRKEKNLPNRSPFLSAMKTIIFGLFLITLLLSLMAPIQIGIVKLRLGPPFNTDAILSALTIIATIGIAAYIYYRSKEDKEKEELSKQLDLLDSLYVELDQISREKRNDETEEGNLQWFNDAIGKGDPLHSVWSINPSPYLSYLPSKINDGETGSLKRRLVKLNQKIEMVNNIVLSEKYKLRGKYPDKEMVKFVKSTILEMIGLTEGMKSELRQKFGVKEHPV